VSVSLLEKRKKCSPRQMKYAEELAWKNSLKPPWNTQQTPPSGLILKVAGMLGDVCLAHLS